MPEPVVSAIAVGIVAVPAFLHWRAAKRAGLKLSQLEPGSIDKE